MGKYTDLKGSVYRMKKICVLLLLALLLLLPAAAFADGDVNIEVMIADGVSVVVLTPEYELFSANTFQGAEVPGFRMPLSLTRIEEGAFEGIDAKIVEISENVAYIGSRAFANCKNLREFHIPDSVKEIEPDALKGCDKDVTVYGSTDVAKKFAEDAGFEYKDLSAQPVTPAEREEKAVELPAVKR